MKRSDHKNNGSITFRQRIMDAARRRKEKHAGPAVAGRTGRPAHVVSWSTTNDQRLVLDAIRLGLVATDTGKPVWGRNGIFSSRKALFVAVSKAKEAGWPTTPENEATAQALSDSWGVEQ